MIFSVSLSTSFDLICNNPIFLLPLLSFLRSHFHCAFVVHTHVLLVFLSYFPVIRRTGAIYICCHFSKTILTANKSKKRKKNDHSYAHKKFKWKCFSLYFVGKYNSPYVTFTSVFIFYFLWKKKLSVTVNNFYLYFIILKSFNENAEYFFFTIFKNNAANGKIFTHFS